jgi:hypothetical protein
MSTIEPTEEQKQAAAKWLDDNDKCPPTETEAWDLAHLLAEREHRATTLWRANEAAARADARVVVQQAENRCGELRVALNVVEIECERRGEKVLELRADLAAARAEIARLQALNAEPVARPDLDAARARITELEHWERIAGDRHHHAVELECREAAHLKRIAELENDHEAMRRDLKKVCDDIEEIEARERAHLARIAELEAYETMCRKTHWVQAPKLPDECPKCQENSAAFFDVEQNRYLCDRCHHPAGEPFTDVEGGEG